MNNEIIYLKDMGVTDTGNVSDGYHTFDELYEHRTVLYAVICNMTSEFDSRLTWKTKRHSDGTLLDGWFLVGINTPDGQITYHIDMKYWDIFKVRELEVAPEYDGHTSSDVLKRVVSLPWAVLSKLLDYAEVIDGLRDETGKCGVMQPDAFNEMYEVIE